MLTIVSGVRPTENESKSRMWPFWQIIRIPHEQFVRDDFLNVSNDIISYDLTKIIQMHYDCTFIWGLGPYKSPKLSKMGTKRG